MRYQYRHRQEPEYEIIDDGAPLEIMERPQAPYEGSRDDCGGRWEPRQLGSYMPAAVETYFNSAAVAPETDSPIETYLGAAILTLFRAKGHDLKMVRAHELGDAADGQLVLVPQYRWHHYRSDWAIFRTGGNAGALLIECDGKEFHSSKAAIEHDRQKDQAARDYGHLTLRFTGSELFRDAPRCAGLVFTSITGEPA